MPGREANPEIPDPPDKEYLQRHPEKQVPGAVLHPSVIYRSQAAGDVGGQDEEEEYYQQDRYVRGLLC